MILSFFLLFFISIFLSQIYRYYLGAYPYFALIFVAFFILLKCRSKKYRLILNAESVLPILIMILSILSTIINGGGIGSIVTVFITVYGIKCFDKLHIPDFEIAILKIIVAVTWVVYTFYFAGNTWELYRSGNNEINPNTVATVAMLTCIILVYLIDDSEFFRLHKILSYCMPIILICFTFVACLETQSRGSIIALFAYIIFAKVPLLRKVAHKVTHIILLVLWIIGTLFPIYFTGMFERNVQIRIPLTNKPLYTGREHLWLDMLQALRSSKSSLIFGVGSNYSSFYFAGNSHNWFFGYVFYFGILFSIIYFVYIIHYIHKINNIELNCFMICIFVQGFFESGLMFAVDQIFLFSSIVTSS